jgi:DNA polymerase II large subunit
MKEVYCVCCGAKYTKPETSSYELVCGECGVCLTVTRTENENETMITAEFPEEDK